MAKTAGNLFLHLCLLANVIVGPQAHFKKLWELGNGHYKFLFDSVTILRDSLQSDVPKYNYIAQGRHGATGSARSRPTPLKHIHNESGGGCAHGAHRKDPIRFKANQSGY